MRELFVSAQGVLGLAGPSLGGGAQTWTSGRECRCSQEHIQEGSHPCCWPLEQPSPLGQLPSCFLWPLLQPSMAQLPCAQFKGLQGSVWPAGHSLTLVQARPSATLH